MTGITHLQVPLLHIGTSSMPLSINRLVNKSKVTAREVPLTPRLNSCHESLLVIERHIDDTHTSSSRDHHADEKLFLQIQAPLSSVYYGSLIWHFSTRRVFILMSQKNLLITHLGLFFWPPPMEEDLAKGPVHLCFLPSIHLSVLNNSS